MLVSASANGQGKDVFVNSHFDDLSIEHRFIAVLPFKVNLELKPGQLAKLPEGEFEKMKKDGGELIQNAVYSLLLKENEARRIVIKDIKEVNAILFRNGISQENIDKYPPSQLAELLGVDAIVGGELRTTKPDILEPNTSKAMPIGFGAAQKIGATSVTIHNGFDGELLWKYGKQLVRAFGSDPDTIYRTLLRKTVRTIPYFK